MGHKVNEQEQALALSIDPNSFKALTIKFQGLLGIGESYLLDPEG